MKAIQVLLSGCFLITQAFAQTDSSSSTTKDESQAIHSIADAVWTAISLGDMEDLKPLIREIDVQHIPTPKGEGAEIMKLKSLEQLKPLRDEIKKAIKDAFVFGEPEFTEDKMAASVKIQPNAEKLLTLCELKMVYDIYLAEAYRDQREGRDIQALATVKTTVLPQSSPYRKVIEQKVAGIQKAQLPPLHFERTEKGWRVNLSKLLAK